jgi:hypothetical protein
VKLNFKVKYFKPNFLFNQLHLIADAEEGDSGLKGKLVVIVALSLGLERSHSVMV